MAIQQLLRTYRDPDAEEQAQLRSANLLAAQSTPEAIAKKEAEAKKTSNIDALTQQILGQKTTDKWTGEGYGGAEANAKAMAKLLADAGITDIKQFGKVDKYEPVEVVGYSLNGKTVQNPSKGKYYEEIVDYDSENGYTTRVRYLTPQEIAQVKPVYGIEEFDSDGMRSVRTPTSVVEKDGKMMGVYGTTYGNKETGQAIESGTGRWQKQGGEGLFSGTGEGEGNTGFRVNIQDDGTPVFYTTKGSSSDLADIMPIIQIGLMATGAGGALGNALLGAGANQLAAGALGGALLGGGTAALTDQDILKGALLGGAGGALSNVLGEALSSGDVSNVAGGGEPIDFVGGTTESINDALQQQFVNDLKAAGVGNVSEFINNVGGNISSFVPSEASVVAPPVETVQVTTPSAPTVVPNLADVISAIVAAPQTAVQPPIENVQVSSESGGNGGNSGLIVIGSDEYGFPVYGTVDSVVADSPVNLSNGRIEAPAYVGFNPDTDLGSGFDSNVISYKGGEGGNEGGSEGGGGEEQVPNIQVTATTPPAAPTIADVINSIVQTQVTQQPETQEIIVTGDAPVQTEQPQAPIIVAPPIDTTLPEVTTIAERPSTITNEVEPAPVIVAPPIDTALPEKTYTTKEIIDMIRLGTLGASILGAGAAATQDSEPTGFDIVPVPTDWTSPTAPKVADFTPLTPIDFGTRDLLKGTQWEKFLNPNYGQVPAPVQFNQPSNMSYDRLMSILGSGRDTLPSQALTINDVISGIQNQYGQIPTSSMGQKFA